MACCAKLPLALLAGARMRSSIVNGFSTEGNEEKLLTDKGSKTTHCILTDQMQDKFHNSHKPSFVKKDTLYAMGSHAPTSAPTKRNFLWTNKYNTAYCPLSNITLVQTFS